jgi:hypothetical protein
LDDNTKSPGSVELQPLNITNEQSQRREPKEIVVDTAEADLLSQPLNELLAVTSPNNITFLPERTAEHINLLSGLEHNIARHLEQSTQREEMMSSLLLGYRHADDSSKQNKLFSKEVSDTGSTSIDTLTTPKVLLQKYRRYMRYTKMKVKIIEELGCLDKQRQYLQRSTVNSSNEI